MVKCQKGERNVRLGIDRVGSNSKNTLDLWFLDSDFFGFGVGDAYHEQKIAGQTRIPAGVYKVGLTYSPRFKHDMWEVLNVPGFSGIRIHTGNTAEDTEGCLLVGWSAERDFDGRFAIYRSTEAFRELNARLMTAHDAGEEIKIKISDEILERSDTDW